MSAHGSGWMCYYQDHEMTLSHFHSLVLLSSFWDFSVDSADGWCCVLGFKDTAPVDHLTSSPSDGQRHKNRDMKKQFCGRQPQRLQIKQNLLFLCCSTSSRRLRAGGFPLASTYVAGGAKIVKVQPIPTAKSTLDQIQDMN